MGHSYNYGRVTSAKGATSESVRLLIGAANTVTIDEDCGAGLIASVVRTASGIYTLQLAAPYPPKAIIITANLSQAGETTAVLVCRYKRASYNPTTGTFIVNVSTAAGTAAADPATGDEIHVDMQFRRYTANP